MDKEQFRKICRGIFRFILLLLRRFTRHSRSDGGRFKKKEMCYYSHEVSSKEKEE